MNFSERKYIVVSDFIKDKDIVSLADVIQKVIDENPNRTIYFPDGKYVIDKPIYISANPGESVSIRMGDFAHIKASNNWDNKDAMICLGGKNPTNDNFTAGSNYGLSGGIIDGNGKAVAVSIDSGRETYIRNTSIKNAKIGIHIKFGANSGSSDADIYGVNITGTGDKNCIGILTEGFDNTFTNIRLAKVFVGIKLDSSGNMLRNVHPLYTYGNEDADKMYGESIGFLDCRGNNFYDYCYSDQLATGFCVKGDGASTFHNCWVFYYRESEELHKGFCAEGKFNSLLSNFKIDFKPEQENICVLSEGDTGGCGTIENLRVNKECEDDVVYKKYLFGKVMR